MRILSCLLFLLCAFESSAEDSADFITATEIIIQKGDHLYKFARIFDLGVSEILRANPNITDPHLIHIGEKIILPAVHLLPDVKLEGIVINLAEPRLYFFSEERRFSFPISIGADEKTPLGKTKVIRKAENPVWIPPASIREEDPTLPEVVPSGPQNPLGHRALYLDGSKHSKWQGIMIHGTNAPRSIGFKVSHGCIRLYPEDIEMLFDEVEIDAPVVVVNQPLKLEERGEKIYLEVHLQEAPDTVFENLGVKKFICNKIKNCERRVDWTRVDEVVIQSRGVPVDVAH